MSLLGSIAKIGKTVVRGVAAYYTGGASELYYQARAAQKTQGQIPSGLDIATPGYAPQAAMPGVGFQPAMAILPRAGTSLAPTIGRGLGIAAGAGLAGARRIASSAVTYCRRHPTWCATIGGTAAVEGLIRGGQLPPIKRRRRKGISASDLSKFRRVAGFLHKWGPMCQGARRPRRSKTCR
jgi:hypothetical protein